MKWRGRNDLNQAIHLYWLAIEPKKCLDCVIIFADKPPWIRLTSIYFKAIYL